MLIISNNTFAVSTFGAPQSSTAVDDIEYEDEDEEYDDEDYFPPEKVNGDLESKSSKLDKEEKSPKEQKIIKESDLLGKPEKLKTESKKDSLLDIPKGRSIDVASPPSTTTSKPNKNYNLNISESSKIYSQNSPNQKQQAAISVPSSIKYRLNQTQNGRTQTYPSTSTEKLPEGFKGKVEEKKYHTRFLPSKHALNSHGEGKELKENESTGKTSPDTFVTVTKSITGSVDNTKTPAEDKQNFASTYYTKSSTCGYFTFSCNIVYGANGRSKICRPKAPANGKC